MDILEAIAYAILGFILWAVILKYTTFKTNWIYFLFVLFYLLSQLPFILLFINSITSGNWNNFSFFYPLERIASQLFFFEYTYYLLAVLTGGLIVIRFIPYFSNKFEVKSKQKKEQTKMEEKIEEQKLISYGMICWEKEKLKKQRKELETKKKRKKT